MTLAIAKGISSFPPNVPPVDQSDEAVFVLTASQLQDIIKQVIAPLEARIEALEARQDEEIARLEATVTAQAEEITALKENWREARPLSTVTRLDDLWAWVEEIDSRTSSQAAEPTPTSKTQDHIDHLARVMMEDKRRSVSVATAAKLLGISKERMRQLKPLLLADSRFELGWDRQRGQRKRVVIRLKQFIK
jgi:hypothetical protein